MLTPHYELKKSYFHLAKECSASNSLYFDLCAACLQHFQLIFIGEHLGIMFEELTLTNL